MAKDINREKIMPGTIHLTVIDSVGKEFPITGANKEREKPGEVAYSPG
jgi:hypothetical protein